MARIELTLREQHMEVFRSEKRFIVLVGGRRWGKTTLALCWLIRHACSSENQTCYFVAPTYKQAKRIAWRNLKRLVGPELIRAKREDELELELVNGSIIQLHGAGDADALRGVGLNAIVLDEYAQMGPEVWEAVVRPMLSDHKGRALFIGTPAGHNAFYDLYVRAQAGGDWAGFHYATQEGGYVSSEELAAIRCETDPRLFRQEYEASFETPQGRVYYSFCRESNVSNLEIIPGAALHIGMDFNVNPMTAVVAQCAGDQCHVIDEIVLPNSNTQEMMQEINRRYPSRNGYVHPDPSGSARKTSAPVGQNDFALIRQAGWRVNPPPYGPVVDRITNVNAMLCNANDQRRLLIDRKCQQLIRGLDTLTYKKGTKIPDKSGGQDHITDALGYLVVAAFPMVRSALKVQESPFW
ncbi:MAG TPA: terminase family protein [Terriglobales bacterium]|nr:terminase family protein [Terriglobales bacterium]